MELGNQLRFDGKGNIVWPKRKIVSEIIQGNIAFKCTFNDNGYRGVCSDEVYRYNTNAGRVWCTDQNNRCREFINKEVTEKCFPCYESALFLNWSFGTGIARREKHYGKPFPIKKAYPGKLAFLTTRDSHQEEEDRYIFGFLHIKDISQLRDPTGPVDEIVRSTFVIGDPENSLAFRPGIRPRFWNYYENPKSRTTIQWRTGLFRYISDKTVLEMLRDLKEEYTGLRDQSALKIIDFQISRYE